MRTAAIVIALGLLAGIADAHVTVAPREATLGGNQVYTVRVPAEGNAPTVFTTLEISEGVTVSRVKAVPELKHEVKREGDRIVMITWTMEVHPGEYTEFQFIARNPEEGTEIAWKAKQHHPDGTSTDWVGPQADRWPASVTRLVAADE